MLCLQRVVDAVSGFALGLGLDMYSVALKNKTRREMPSIRLFVSLVSAVKMSLG
jgi:hypothetical protein